MANKLYNVITAGLIAGASLLSLAGCKEACKMPKGLEQYLSSSEAYEPTKNIVKSIYTNPQEVKEKYPEVFKNGINPYELTVEQIKKYETEVPWTLVRDLSLLDKYSTETKIKDTGIKLDDSTAAMIQYLYASDNFSLGML